LLDSSVVRSPGPFPGLCLANSALSIVLLFSSCSEPVGDGCLVLACLGGIFLCAMVLWRACLSLSSGLGPVGPVFGGSLFYDPDETV
jgi:hypothetical protein